jgi:LmbE family N-acetylglucosaminyl deacetylase
MSKIFDIMVIIAHPDDAEFGAAGSIAKWVADGKSAIYVVCTNGEKGSSDRNLSSETLARMRQQEQLDAVQQLGVSDVVFLGMPDQGLEDTPAFRESIVKEIRRYQPKIVLSPDPYRRYLWHRDHRIVGQVVMDSLFPYARDHLAYPEMLRQGLEPHKVREVYFFGAEEVNQHIDITETFPQKLAALRCHASQIREMRVGDLEEWLKERCRNMAEGTSCKLAEAFHRVALPD